MGEGPTTEGHCNLLEHLTSLYNGKPKAVSICVVITSPTAMALNEWCTSKLFQTGTGGCKGLARTFRPSAGVLWNKGTTCQQFSPTERRGRHCSQGGARMLLPESQPSASCSHHGTHSCPHCPQPASWSLLRPLCRVALHTVPESVNHSSQNRRRPVQLH